MPNTSNPFAHRANPDGTTDSICKTCFSTIGTTQNALALKEPEDTHICDPWKLEVIKTALSKISRSRDISK